MLKMMMRLVRTVMMRHYNCLDFFLQLLFFNADRDISTAGGKYFLTTSQELRMLSRSLSDCKVTVSNSQLVKKSLLIEI